MLLSLHAKCAELQWTHGAINVITLREHRRLTVVIEDSWPCSYTLIAPYLVFAGSMRSSYVHFLNTHGSLRLIDHALEPLDWLSSCNHRELPALQLNEHNSIPLAKPECGSYFSRDCDLA